MKKVLYISYDGMTDPLGQSQVLPYLSGLTRKGHTIHLISFEKKDRYQELGQEIQSYCDQNNIHWYPEWYTSNPPILATLNDVRKCWNRAKSLQEQYAFDIVHCRSYIAALIGQRLKKKFNVDFLFDMRGFWADERVDGKIWNLSNPLFKQVYQFFKKKEKSFLFNADAVVSLTKKAKSEMITWDVTPDLATKTTVIPCCADLDLFKTGRNAAPQNTPFILGYIGSIGTWYMLDEMLDFFKVLKQQKPTAVFHFATKENRENIIKIAKAKGLSETDFKVESFKHSDVPKFIETLSASVLFILPTYSKMASCPTKLGELMAMGVPVICNAGVGDTETIVVESSAGALVHSLDEVGYMEAINQLSNFDFIKATNGAQRIFSLENGVESYHKIYSTIS